MMRKLLVSFVFLCTLIISTLPFSSVPAAAATQKAPTESLPTAFALQPGQHCVVQLEKLHPGQRVSRVLSRQCATSTQQLILPKDSTVLMTWYQGYNYDPSAPSVVITGSDGPCDAQGYGIAYVGDSWNDRISSFTIHNNCLYASAYVDRDYQGYCVSFGRNVPNLALYGLDKKTSSFWVAATNPNCRRG